MIDVKRDTAPGPGSGTALGPRAPSRHALPSRLLHELRTPLNHIIGYSDMLVEQALQEGQNGFVPDIQSVRAAGGQLLALIDDNFNSIPSPEPAVPAARTIAALNDVSELQGPEPGAIGTTAGVLLVVDDNASNRDVLTRRLKRQGYSVVAAENGIQALEQMGVRDFDLVLLDIMMPEMDGFEVLSRLKSDDRLRHIPVIMISALSDADAVARCIEMGAEDYLPKPFDPTLLKARTVACLERKRARDREVRYTADLRESYQRGQELEQMREDLTHMIVHDLRTPLSSVISGLQTLAAMGDLNEPQQEMLDISLAGGRTLLAMIGDLLDIGKLECGTVLADLREVTSSDIVAMAHRQVAVLASAKDLTLTAHIEPGLPAFTADHDKLVRTLVNLMSNAIKFTPAGGAVKIATRMSKDGKSLLFSVTDTGEGIPAEAFGRIFEKFRQVETRSAGHTHSTGLGLTFCKLVVEAHGGTIWVESEMGIGTTFFFTIAIRQTPDCEG
jgi:two-component system, sensor histidine kinase and response regulator